MSLPPAFTPQQANRHRALMKEFQQYLDSKGKLKVVRTEALRAGFKECWQKKDYTTIVQMAKRVPDAVIQEDPALLMYFDNASLLKGDMKAVTAGGEKAVAQLVMATHAGMTSDEFSAVVSDWIATARHPKTKRPYPAMTYQPMRELLAYLRANGFKTFIVSGGGIEFMRPWAERVYGVPPEQVIGSSIKTKFEMKDMSRHFSGCPT